MTNNEEKVMRLLTVAQFANKHPAFSQSSLRHLIFDARANGFHAVIRRIRKKVLIDERAFFDWVAQQQGGIL